MISRRDILNAIAAAPLLGIGLSVFPAISMADDVGSDIESWIKDPAHSNYFDPPKVSQTQRGSLILAPTDAMVKKASQILAGVPANLSPIETARWMMNKVPADFTMEWPPDTPAHKLPANPLIVAFFAATKTAPYQGDETAWCAAFVCWVLNHCGKPYSNDAGSKSFRKFAPLPPTTTPVIGDIVVFKHLSSPNQGHVAFFDGFADDAKTKVWCLGGNQGNRISRKAFTVAKGDLRVDSYHHVA